MSGWVAKRKEPQKGLGVFSGSARRRTRLSLAISAALAITGSASVSAEAFPPFISLFDLSIEDGLIIRGQAEDDRFGFSVSRAGDVNGDGFNDLIIGAPGSAESGNPGRAYVIFGNPNGFASPFNLGNLNGSNGFLINGESSNDRAGISVSAAGDFNGDGVDDLIIGAPRSDINGNDSGRAYVVFGTQSAFPDTVNLSDIDGLSGVDFRGDVIGSYTGSAVGLAGDVNFDGIDDVVIRSARGSPGNTLRLYVVFGSDAPIPSPFNLDGLDGSSGFVLDGIRNLVSFGKVGNGGDINGDGIDDLLVSEYAANQGRGASYLVFGRQGNFSSQISLPVLPDDSGIVLVGDPLDLSGFSVDGAGDFNGDGLNDVVVGAPGLYGGLYGNNGRSYVVFGSELKFPNPLNLGELNGVNGGFELIGESAGDEAGLSVSSAGDINGDGLDDVVIGAPGGGDSDVKYDFGRSYVVFGRTGRPPNPLQLGSLDGRDGFVVGGASADGQAGFSVSSLGDVNGDGIDDLLIGAPYAQIFNTSGIRAGVSYVIFGRSERVFNDRFELK